MTDCLLDFPLILMPILSSDFYKTKSFPRNTCVSCIIRPLHLKKCDKQTGPYTKSVTDKWMNKLRKKRSVTASLLKQMKHTEERTLIALTRKSVHIILKYLLDFVMFSVSYIWLVSWNLHSVHLAQVFSLPESKICLWLEVHKTVIGFQIQFFFIFVTKSQITRLVLELLEFCHKNLSILWCSLKDMAWHCFFNKKPCAILKKTRHCFTIFIPERRWGWQKKWCFMLYSQRLGKTCNPQHSHIKTQNCWIRNTNESSSYSLF